MQRRIKFDIQLGELEASASTITGIPQQKSKNWIPYDPVIPLLGIKLKEPKSTCHRESQYPYILQKLGCGIFLLF